MFQKFVQKKTFEAPCEPQFSVTFGWPGTVKCASLMVSSEKTVFAGGDKVHRGFQAMADRYRAAYPMREKMGRLTFSNLVFEQLEGDRTVVTGSWELEITGSEKRPGGVFTLLWRRFPDGWKIVHDHTSSRP